MQKIKIENLEQMQKAAEIFLRKISAKAPKNSATIISLSGDLGSGKTTFVQNVGKVLKIKEKINSPTFVVSKIYKIPKNPTGPTCWKKMIHIDAYRLGGENDVRNIGLDMQMQNPENLIFIEWAEIIKKGLPKNILEVEFQYLSETERQIKF